jgi:hypothetical protein
MWLFDFKWKLWYDDPAFVMSVFSATLAGTDPSRGFLSQNEAFGDYLRYVASLVLSFFGGNRSLTVTASA